MTSPLFCWLRDRDDLDVVRWLTPDDEYPARGEHVEACWLPLLGPSAYTVARRLAVVLADTPHASVHLATLGAECGFGKPWVALDRLGRYGLVRRHGDVLQVRTVFPPVPLGSVHKLPEHLREKAAAA